MTLDDAWLTAVMPERGPTVQREPLARAFEMGARLLVSDPGVRVEVLRALAERLSPDSLSTPLDRKRLAFWNGYRAPAPSLVERFAYVRARDDGEVRQACSWRLDRDGVHFRERADADDSFDTADFCFLAGPPTCWAPAWHRAQLRARLLERLSPDARTAAGPGFAVLDYDAVTAGEYRWDAREDGESFGSVSAGEVLSGYQYGHDYGYSSFSCERVLAEDFWTRVSVHIAPDALAHIREALSRTVRADFAALPECASVELTPEQRAGVYDALCERITALSTDGPLRRMRSLSGFEPLRDELQWSASAALGLFASLAPSRPLAAFGLPVSSPTRGAFYHFSQDALWPSTDGAGVLRAHACLSNAGGVEARWHVMPSRERLVSFAIAQDYTQTELEVSVAAESEPAVTALLAHATAYFEAMGLRAQAPR